MVVNDNGQVTGDPPFGLEYLEPANNHTGYGNAMPPIDPTIFRHYHLNINGLSLQDDFIEAQNLSNGLQITGCTSASIVEHNCNMGHPEVKNNLHDIMRREDRRAATVFSHIKGESHNFEGYQPGGTLLSINSSVSSRIVHRHADEYARWSHATLSAKGGSRVHIISAYRVCQTTENGTGPNTA